MFIPKYRAMKFKAHQKAKIKVKQNQLVAVFLIVSEFP